VLDVPFDIDLAVLIIPPRFVPEAVADCARKGAKGVVITSEGFGESGQEGRRYQEAVSDVLKRTGMRAFGPNTLGIVNTETGLTTSYFADERMLQRGSIGFAAQSGIFVGALLRYLASFDGLRISKGIGLGNKVDVDEADALDFFAEDGQTKTVGLYLEDVRDGRRFAESARRAAARKPVLVLKGGRSQEGARATASHTASLAVDDVVFDGALRQAGVLRMDGIADMLATLMGFEWMPLPRGSRIAVATFSGAQAILSVDAAVEEGLGMAEFSPRTNERLSRVISFPSKMHNPIDLFPDMMTHGFEKTSREILKALLDDDGVHGIVFIGFAMLSEQMFRPMAEVIREDRRKPVFVSLLGNREDLAVTEDFLRKERIPVMPFPEVAVQVFARMWRYAERKSSRQQPP
jgi:acyl-CoA synthetase (NDP forming)